MKKLTKCLAVLSSAVMALSAGIMQASAGFEDIVYDEIITAPNGYVYPLRIYDCMQYMGIIFKMPDGVVPTAEELGIDGVISKYTADNYGSGLLEMLIDKGGSGWGFEDTVEPTENQYVIQTEYMMSEEEAEKLAEKLVVRGLVEEAGVWYWHVIQKGTVRIEEDTTHLEIIFKNEEEAGKFSLEKYPEIKDMLKYSNYSERKINGTTVDLLCSDDSSYYYDPEKGTYDSMGLYNDVKSLNEIMASKYDEIEKVDLHYQIPYSSGETTNAVCSAKPVWGDATNDDVINLYDAIEISKYIMNISGIDEDTVLLADINRDGKTDIYDAIEVAKCIMEK